MTKKHFIALADVLRSIEPTEQRRPVTGQELWQITRNALANFCESQNPRFNRERWLGYIAGTNGKNGGRVK